MKNNLDQFFKDDQMKKKAIKKLIEDAYERRKKEIESLRLYDMGEKVIAVQELSFLLQQKYLSKK